MIDWDKPIRTVRSKRQLYATGWMGGWRMLDTFRNSSGSGLPYHADGVPVDPDIPWGPIENFDPLEDYLVFENATPPEALRFAREAAAQNDQNPLWGMF